MESTLKTRIGTTLRRPGAPTSQAVVADRVLHLAHAVSTRLGAAVVVFAVLAVWALWVAVLVFAGDELARVLHQLVVPGRMGG